MNNWEKTKRLLFTEDPIFLYARKGDVAGIMASVNILSIDARDSKGYTPLHVVAAKGFVEATEILVKLSADLNARDNHGNSPLMAATFYGHEKVVEILLENGADPEVLNLRRQSAILFARTFGHRKIEQLLSA